MRTLDLPDQSWSIDDAEDSITPSPATADAAADSDDDVQYRSFHYGA